MRSEDLSGEIQGESGESQPAEPTDDAEAGADVGSIQGDFIYRLHTELRVQLHVPKEETFPIPLKYTDVSRSTHANLDVMQEKRNDDYWNVDSSKHPSDSWRRFTKFITLKEKPLKGHMWSGESLTKIQTITRPDHVWSEVWMKIGKAAQNREKQEWAKEKPKLDTARRLRGIYFRDPDDEEYKEIFKNARRKMERPMTPAMPCKRQTSIAKANAKPKIGNEKESKNNVWLYSGHNMSKKL